MPACTAQSSMLTGAFAPRCICRACQTTHPACRLRLQCEHCATAAAGATRGQPGRRSGPGQEGRRQQRQWRCSGRQSSSGRAGQRQGGPGGGGAGGAWASAACCWCWQVHCGRRRACSPACTCGHVRAWLRMPTPQSSTRLPPCPPACLPLLCARPGGRHGAVPAALWPGAPPAAPQGRRQREAEAELPAFPAPAACRASGRRAEAAAARAAGAERHQLWGVCVCAGRRGGPAGRGAGPPGDGGAGRAAGARGALVVLAVCCV